MGSIGVNLCFVLLQLLFDPVIQLTLLAVWEMCQELVNSLLTLPKSLHAAHVIQYLVQMSCCIGVDLISAVKFFPDQTKTLRAFVGD